MATIMYIREQKQSIAAMKGVMDYCCRDEKVTDTDGNHYVSGVNCDGENAFVEFMATKNAYQKADGTTFYQYVQSFSPEENISPQQAHDTAIAFAKQAWLGHEILITTHCDTDHIHSHFVINSVSFETGYKLRQNPNTLKALRNLSDCICKEKGFSVLEPYESDGAKIGTREYRAASKGESWKFQLMVAIDNTMNRCGSRREFINELRRQGYEILWTDTRKYITFTCPNKMKCRDIKLHDKKYVKENIENELRIRQEILGGQTQAEQSGGAVADGKRAVPSGGLRADGESAPHTHNPAGTGGGISAGALRTDISACNAGEDGVVLHGAAADDNRLGGGHGENDGRAERRNPAADESDSLKNDGAYLTGWEESRRIFFKNLRDGGQQDNSARLRYIRYAPENSADFVRNGGGVGAALGRGLSAASRIIDDTSEDPEQRKKHIEAEQNGADLGAVIGLAIGAAAELLHKDVAENEEPAEESTPEENQPTMNL